MNFRFTSEIAWSRNVSKLLALSASLSLWNANSEIYIERQSSIALEYLLISLTHYRRTEVPSTLLISESGTTKIVTVHCLYRTLSRWGLQSELKWCILLSYLDTCRVYEQNPSIFVSHTCKNFLYECANRQIKAIL